MAAASHSGAPFPRVLLLVLDSVGIGEMPDTGAYGDAGSDTLGHLAEFRPLRLPNLTALGLANIRPLRHLPAAARPRAFYGKCELASPGKDTTTGHWEIAGIHLDRPFPLYPEGFPDEVLDPFRDRIGRDVLGNCAASGTEIIARLGEQHLATGSPIVYTSADSVFQVAAHKSVIPLEELYRICEIARELLTGAHEVGRVIARPFEGEPGSFTRDSAGRHDYAVPPPPGMLLDQLAAAGVPVHAIGKISDVYLGRGIATSRKTKNNAEGMAATLDSLRDHRDGLHFVNLVDFDSLYGHRNDAEGYARALEAVDAWLPSLLDNLGNGTLLLITADHGCDPTTPSTDHSREFVPLLALSPRHPSGSSLGVRASLSDIGQTIADNFAVTIPHGTSFLKELE